MYGFSSGDKAQAHAGVRLRAPDDPPPRDDGDEMHDTPSPLDALDVRKSEEIAEVYMREEFSKGERVERIARHSTRLVSAERRRPRRAPGRWRGGGRRAAAGTRPHSARGARRPCLVVTDCALARGTRYALDETTLLALVRQLRRLARLARRR